MKAISLFSGCGGMDLGFVQAGFQIAYANDIDRDAIATYRLNFGSEIDTRSISGIKPEWLPDADGIIGGPPCQSWSLAGALRGEDDPRGKLFYDYARMLEAKMPLFFVAENVPGIVSSRNIAAFRRILAVLARPGYDVQWRQLDSRDYCVAQERKRVIIVGMRKDVGAHYRFPEKRCTKEGSSIDGSPTRRWLTLRDAIGDLPDPVPAMPGNKPNKGLDVPNHEYMVGAFSPIYMSRNRKRGWDQPSYTIQAGGRHAPLHPDSCDMCKVGEDRFEFAGPNYRRLSVREAARVQGFPDSFIFKYRNVADGYKVIGNAVPPPLAMAVAESIRDALAVSGVQELNGGAEGGANGQ